MTNLFVPVLHGAALDRPDEADTVAAAQHIAASLQRLGFASEVIATGEDLGAIDALAVRRPLLVFNLVEALGGCASQAVRAFRRLDDRGLAYTGSDAAAYNTANSKIETKARLGAHGIRTPRYWLRGMKVPDDLRVIVKSVDEHGSLGMDQGSVVTGRFAQCEIALREARFGGSFFAEAFIDGREFNVSMLATERGVRVLPLAEIDFDTLRGDTLAIVDFAAKWDPTAASYHQMGRRFGCETREPALAGEIKHISLACWEAFGLSGYARVDFRIAPDGQPYVLEVNANPCLAPDAGFAAAAVEAGFDYDATIAAIVAAARCSERCPT